ncbi:MAG: bifunctional DNA primase/polymerase, partial [Phototrophicaceae bacterium]
MKSNKTNANPIFLAAAQTYLAKNWSVIPVWATAHVEFFKVAAIKWLRYCRQHASSDQIDHWFKFGAFQGVGIITGSISDLAVLDFDCSDKYQLFCQLFPHLTNTYTVKTPNGWHLYFHIPKTCTTRTLQKDGTDWQWEGRYVVAPPTQGYTL